VILDHILEHKRQVLCIFLLVESLHDEEVDVIATNQHPEYLVQLLDDDLPFFSAASIDQNLIPERKHYRYDLI
jgi:hypothetical protein